MPKRSNTLTIFSPPELQGDDAFIVVRSPSTGTMQNYRELIGSLIARQNKYADTPEFGLKSIEIAGEVENAGHNLIREHVISWNWVDDDDNPLPQPNEDGAIELLSVAERDWIMKQFQPKAEKKGN